MTNKASAGKQRTFGSSGLWLGIGLAVGLGLGFSSGSVSGGEFLPALAWNLISFGLGAVAVLLFQWATGRDAKRKPVAADL